MKSSAIGWTAVLALVLSACLSGCEAPAGYHYAGENFSTPIPNDPCMLSFMNSKNVLDLINKSVGEPISPPERITRVLHSLDAPAEEVEALGLPIDVSPPMICAVSVQFASGKRASGVLDVYYSAPSSFLVYWDAAADIPRIEAAKRRAAMELRRQEAKEYALPKGFPRDCIEATPYERRLIPETLGLAAGDATIVKIKDWTPTGRPVPYAPSGRHWRWELQCTISVLWSNGAEDTGYQFKIRGGRYGGYDVAYGPSD